VDGIHPVGSVGTKKRWFAQFVAIETQGSMRGTPYDVGSAVRGVP
jgi:hypothetical protein